MAVQVILTVVGSDRPGLVRHLADAVLAAGGNWLESHLSRLAGQFVGAVLVELSADRVDALAQGVRAVDGGDLGVTLVRVPDSAPPAEGRRIRLELVGQDRPGIVREVSAVLAASAINIETFESGLAHGAWSGERLFRATLDLTVPAAVSLDGLRQTLERLSGELMVDIALREDNGQTG